MKPGHVPPPELAERRVPKSVVGEWSQSTRCCRSCWYRGTTYLTAADATRCELALEDANRRERQTSPAASGGQA